MRLLLLSILLLARSASPASAQTGSTETPPPTFPHDRGHVTLQAGLIQPALFRGGNVAASYKRGRLVADYSHGFNLDFNANGNVGLRGDQRDQNLDIDVPWTTGFGVGYRITPRLDVRLEGKAHRYEIDPPADAPFAYTTFTVGPGVYYELPVWRRLTLEGSVRYWPTVATTLSGGERAFAAPGGGTDVHHAYDLPVITNVSVGWRL